VAHRGGLRRRIYRAGIALNSSSHRGGGSSNSVLAAANDVMHGAGGVAGTTSFWYF